MLIIKLPLYKFYKIEFITYLIIQFTASLALGLKKSAAASAASFYMNSEYLMTPLL